jgi:hypothetical protein
MHWGCALGHVEYLASLARLPIKLVNTNRQSPLAFAVTRQENYYRQSFSALQPLYAAEPCRDVNGRTFLHTIVAQSKNDGCELSSRYYLECVADWIDKSRDSHEHTEDITSLLNAQVCFVSSNFKDNMGNTALHLAILHSQPNMVKILLSLRCEVNVANKNNSTSYSLMRANPSVYTRMIQVLMQNEFDLGFMPSPPQQVTNVKLNEAKTPRDIGQIINERLAPVAESMRQQNQDLKHVEECIKSVEQDVNQAINRASGEHKALKEQNRLYRKLTGIVSRLESAIQNVTKLTSGGKRKRADDYESGGENLHKLVATNVEVDALAELVAKEAK